MKAYFHPDQLLHHPKTYLSRGAMRQPQEVPERVEPLLNTLGMLGVDVLKPNDFGLVPILAVHDADYISFLRTAHAQWLQAGRDWGDEVISNIFVRGQVPPRSILGAAANYLADGSCPIGPYTWQTAYAAAQSAIAAASEVLSGSRLSYALCRPPGHHARRAAAGGFCYINNAAIAAQHLRGRFSRVTVLDTDVHHGQGLQEIFYDRSDVQYVSIHGHPANFYPVVTGFEDETGSGEGQGYNVNLPIPHGSTEAYFFERINQAMDAIRQFEPDCLVLCNGYDIYSGDPQSIVDFSTVGFQKLAAMVASLDLPTVIIQEGGYAVDMLQANSLSFFAGFGYQPRSKSA